MDDRKDSTDEGKRRYPPNGIYTGGMNDDPEMWDICTCQETCPPSCKGHCCCKACLMAYNDFLSNR